MSALGVSGDQVYKYGRERRYEECYPKDNKREIRRNECRRRDVTRGRRTKRGLVYKGAKQGSEGGKEGKKERRKGGKEERRE